MTPGRDPPAHEPPAGGAPTLRALTVPPELAGERLDVALARRQHGELARIGGGLLVAVGLLLVTGLWGRIAAATAGWIGGFETIL